MTCVNASDETRVGDEMHRVQAAVRYVRGYVVIFLLSRGDPRRWKCVHAFTRCAMIQARQGSRAYNAGRDPYLRPIGSLIYKTPTSRSVSVAGFPRVSASSSNLCSTRHPRRVENNPRDSRSPVIRLYIQGVPVFF